MTLRLGTRGSRLALWQANEVQQRLERLGHQVEQVIIKTTGDRRTDVPLSAIGGKGLFIKELEEALTRGEIDLAVHSLKDVPSLVPDEFVLAAYLERADPRDVLVHPTISDIRELPAGARVGTSSPRRRAQLLRHRRDLVIESVRGNVPTRAAKIDEGELDAVILAAAGLQRLNIPFGDAQFIDPALMVPAAGQGIVTIETLGERADVRAALRGINVERSEQAAAIERGVLQRFGTRLDCYSCIAVHAAFASEDGGRPRPPLSSSPGSGPSQSHESGGRGRPPSKSEVTATAFVSDYEALRVIEVSREGSTSELEQLVTSVYDDLLSRGALELLESGAHE